MTSFWHGVMLQKGIDPDLDISKYAEVVRAMCSGGDREEVGRNGHVL